MLLVYSKKKVSKTHYWLDVYIYLYNLTGNPKEGTSSKYNSFDLNQPRVHDVYNVYRWAIFVFLFFKFPFTVVQDGIH